jgi:N6-adenosine-specific RNA methylase IME4
MSDYFAGLNPPYSTIVADPPWEYPTSQPGWRKGSKRIPLPYSTMTRDQINSLPVEDLAGPGSHLYLWSTNHHLEVAFGIAHSWGFTPTTTLVWCKEPRGFGQCGRYTVTTEFIIHGQVPAEKTPKRVVRRAGAEIQAAREAAGLGRAALHHRIRGGTPTGIVHRWEEDDALPNERDWARLQEVLPMLANVERPHIEPPPPRGPDETVRAQSTWFNWPTTAHSVKPAAFLDVVETVSPGPYVELFARQPRLGWDAWGHGYEIGAAS